MQSQANSLPSVRYERDASGTIMRITEDGVRTHMNFIYADGQPVVISPHGTGVTQRLEWAGGGVLLEITDDGVRTHTRFINVEDIAGPPQPSNAQEDGAEAAPAPATEGQGSVMTDEADDNDGGRSSTPTTSGIMGINHWARQAPNMPNVFEGAPGSDQATEIIPVNDDTRLSLPSPSIPALSGASGSTQRPMSEGHARAGSAFLPYQEAQMSEYECVNPGLALRAKAMRLVQACDAAQRNLSVATVNYEVASEVCSSDADPRHFSPCPSSAQVYATSMASREATPMPLPLGDDEKSHGPLFDFASWRWQVDTEMEPEAREEDECVPELKEQVLMAQERSIGRQHGRCFCFECASNTSPLTEESQETVKPRKNVPYVSGLTSRDPTPLTVYTYNTGSEPCVTGKDMRFPATPGSSSSRRRKRYKHTLTRKRTRKLRR